MPDCTNELHIGPLKHDMAEELTSEWPDRYIMPYGLEAGIIKQGSPISTAALALPSLLTLNPILVARREPSTWGWRLMLGLR